MNADSDFPELTKAIRQVPVSTQERSRVAARLGLIENVSAVLPTPSQDSLGNAEIAPTIQAASENVTLASSGSPAQSGSVRWVGWLGMAAAVLLICCAIPWLPNNRQHGPESLGMFVCQQFDSFDLDQLSWRKAERLSKLDLSVIGRLRNLRVMEVASLDESQWGKEAEVISLQSPSGKVVYLFRLKELADSRQFAPQFLPLNSESGGWSCAAMTEQSLVYLIAVPGKPAELQRLIPPVQLTYLFKTSRQASIA